jgi:hypothetical protein
MTMNQYKFKPGDIIKCVKQPAQWFNPHVYHVRVAKVISVYAWVKLEFIQDGQICRGEWGRNFIEENYELA